MTAASGRSLLEGEQRLRNERSPRWAIGASDPSRKSYRVPSLDVTLNRDTFEDGLRQRNFFPRMSRNGDELPPCFTSSGFSKKIANKITTQKNRRAQGYGTIALTTARFNLAPRELEVLHPVPYARIARHLKTHWTDWNSILDNETSAIRVGPHPDGRVFSMAARAERTDIHHPKARFLAKVDITAFYKSIYTHSVPWAIDGVRTAKNNRSGGSSWANGLDGLLQQSRRKETSGVPVGPGTSAVVGEILLGQIDDKLQSALPSANYLRFIDDYYCVTEGRDFAEEFIDVVRSELAALRLNIHPLKTEILDLPVPDSPGWKRKLRRTMSAGASLTRYLDALDDAIDSAHEVTEDSAMRYVLISIERHVAEAASQNKPLGELWVNSISVRLMNLGFVYPVVVGPLCRLLLSLPPSELVLKTVSLNEMVTEHASKRRTDATTWLLYLMISAKLRITANSAKSIAESRDCLSLALLAKCKEWEHLVKEFIEKFEALSPEHYDRDEYWLLYYHFYLHGVTFSSVPREYYEDFDEFAAEKVHFVDMETEAEHRPIPMATTRRSALGPISRLSPYENRPDAY